ncbi:helix-turn-helix domain-containing protein [Pseudoalteromonas sp. T1lg65]|uniref:helix-turn-helix domain-containing protein n=1 Tax=Pseudoalteromonas sp. T1lg65 TaxID=2077101 RepID=UPI003F792DCB
MLNDEEISCLITTDLDLLTREYDPDLVKYMRLTLGMNLRQFAKVAGVSHGTIANWEAGVTRPNDKLYQDCVENFINIRNRHKKLPVRDILFNAKTIAHFKKMFLKLNRDDKKEFIKQFTDEGDQ